jgi:hypothetical protein
MAEEDSKIQGTITIEERATINKDIEIEKTED